MPAGNLIAELERRELRRDRCAPRRRNRQRADRADRGHNAKRDRSSARRPRLWTFRHDRKLSRVCPGPVAAGPGARARDGGFRGSPVAAVKFPGRSSSSAASKSKPDLGSADEHEGRGEDDADECAGVAPAERFLQDKCRKQREDDQRHHLLDDLQLAAREAMGIADPVRRNREAILSRAMHQPTRIAVEIDQLGKRSWPYQASVMNMFETNRARLSSMARCVVLASLLVKGALVILIRARSRPWNSSKRHSLRPKSHRTESRRSSNAAG